MRNKISAIIIDPNYKYHDYSGIKYDDGNSNSENRFDLTVFDTGVGIKEKLYEKRGFDAIITIGDTDIWGDLQYMPFFIRKKWVHIDKFDCGAITSSIIATFKANTIGRDDEPTLFSFFTCTYNSDKEKFERLYRSMCQQTYNEWNWYIIDDSYDWKTTKMIESFKDLRITVLKNVTTHGNIGFNKHTAAMVADGDFLIEVDHDDELTSDCLSTILDAYNAFPNTDFFYSNCLELKMPDKTPIIYGKGWGWGEGLTKTEVVNGVEYTFSESPGVNPFSIRTIYAQPNHIRVWKRDFYHKICGHNVNYSVLDDQELLIRTFLNGEMTKIDKVLYIQYEGEGERGVSTDNTQSIRFAEIQRTTMLLKEAYDKAIHERILSLGYEDTAWNNELGYSTLWINHTPGQNMMNNFYIPEQ